MKKLFILLIVGLIYSSSPKAENPGQDEGSCVSGNCVNGIGTFVFKNGVKSIGTWKDGRLWSGTGLLIYENKDAYYGGVQDNLADGKGKTTYANGKIFKGTFSHGKTTDGEGYLYFLSDSSKYEGTLVNGKFNGIGSYTLSNGTKFSGTFVDGDLTGNGKLTLADGDSYEGNFLKFMREGYGVYRSKDGSVYKGNWTNGKQNGNGEYYDEKGILDYSGEWNNGEMVNPEKSVSYIKTLWEDAKKVFSRVTFKGWQKILTDEISGEAEMTDEYYLNNDYTFYGTNEYIIDFNGKKYRTKQKIVGTYDPVANKIHISTRDILFRDEIEGVTWIRGAADGEVFLSSSHPGHYIIKGKDISGNDFEESDY